MIFVEMVYCITTSLTLFAVWQSWVRRLYVVTLRRSTNVRFHFNDIHISLKYVQTFMIHQLREAIIACYKSSIHEFTALPIVVKDIFLVVKTYKILLNKNNMSRNMIYLRQFLFCGILLQYLSVSVYG